MPMANPDAQRKRNLGHLPDHLPRIEQVIEPARKVCLRLPTW